MGFIHERNDSSQAHTSVRWIKSASRITQVWKQEPETGTLRHDYDYVLVTRTFAEKWMWRGSKSKIYRCLKKKDILNRAYNSKRNLAVYAMYVGVASATTLASVDRVSPRVLSGGSLIFEGAVVVLSHGCSANKKVWERPHKTSHFKTASN